MRKKLITSILCCVATSSALGQGYGVGPMPTLGELVRPGEVLEAPATCFGHENGALEELAGQLEAGAMAREQLSLAREELRKFETVPGPAWYRDPWLALALGLVIGGSAVIAAGVAF